MINRIYLSAAVLVSAVSLTSVAALTPVDKISQNSPTSSASLEEPCLAIDQIMYQSLGPVLDSLEDTPQSRQAVAQALKDNAPTFVDLSEEVADPTASLAFKEFSAASLDLADALESGASSEAVQTRFDTFNATGAQMSMLCLEVFESNATSS